MTQSLDRRQGYVVSLSLKNKDLDERNWHSTPIIVNFDRGFLQHSEFTLTHTLVCTHVKFHIP